MFFSQVAFIALALLYKNKISFSWFVRLQSTDATWTLVAISDRWEINVTILILFRREIASQGWSVTRNSPCNKAHSKKKLFRYGRTLRKFVKFRRCHPITQWYLHFNAMCLNSIFFLSLGRWQLKQLYQV